MLEFSAEMMVPFAIAAVILVAVAIICHSALAGWREWIALQREQIVTRQKDKAQDDGVDGQMMTRIEMADMRERLRQLEAIAAGVDL